jgi:hypothetical protein
VTVALERTHLATHDLDWLPPSYRAVRWTVAGAVWTGIFGAVGALLAFTKFQAIVYGKGLAALAAGGYFAGDRAARAVLRGRLRKLAEGEVDLSRLPAEPDGELVHVEGRIRARETVPAVLTESAVVWRRVAFTIGETRLVHEAAVDFQLVADDERAFASDQQSTALLGPSGRAARDSEAVIIEVGQARLLAADGKARWYAADSSQATFLEQLPLPPELQRTMQRRAQQRARNRKLPRMRAAELCLRDGDAVEILGYKSRVVDPTVATRLERETPFRATLRGGKLLPLLIAPRT